MFRNRKPSDKTFAVLMLLFNNRDRSYYGLEISKLTHTSAGTLYPILARLEEKNWIEGEWEQIDPVKEGRRPRKYYKISPLGVPVAKAALQEHKKLLEDLGVQI